MKIWLIWLAGIRRRWRLGHFIFGFKIQKTQQEWLLVAWPVAGQGLCCDCVLYVSLWSRFCMWYAACSRCHTGVLRALVSFVFLPDGGWRGLGWPSALEAESPHHAVRVQHAVRHRAMAIGLPRVVRPRLCMFREARAEGVLARRGWAYCRLVVCVWAMALRRHVRLLGGLTNMACV